MEVTFIVGLIVTIGIALIPYLKRRYGDRPKLEIEIQYRGGTTAPRGISPKTDTSKGYYESEKAIQIFQLEWRFVVLIRNNSDIAAYYPKIHYKKASTQISQLDKLPNKPILNSDNISLNGKYHKREESLGSERTQINGLPDEFQQLGIILEYQNTHGTKFYSLYEHQNKENPNKHLNKRPRDVKQL